MSFKSFSNHGML